MILKHDWVISVVSIVMYGWFLKIEFSKSFFPNFCNGYRSCLMLIFPVNFFNKFYLKKINSAQGLKIEKW